MDRIHVFVTGSRLLRDVIDCIVSSEPDIEIVRELQQAGVLVCASDDEASRFDELLYERPRLRIIQIEQARRASFLFELRPQRRPLGDLGPDGLLAAIRDDVLQE